MTHENQAGLARVATARGRLRETAILDAVVELIAEIGYERISTDSIAARAHASKATMYRRWPGKAQLVADALRRRAEGDLPATPNTGSIRGDLLAAAARITSTIEGSDGPSFLGLVEGIRDDETLRELVTEQIAAASARAATALVEHARTRGENLVATHVTIAFDVLVSRLFLDALLRPDRTREHEQVRLVDEIVLPLATQ